MLRLRPSFALFWVLALSLFAPSLRADEALASPAEPHASMPSSAHLLDSPMELSQTDGDLLDIEQPMPDAGMAARRPSHRAPARPQIRTSPTLLFTGLFCAVAQTLAPPCAEIAPSAAGTPGHDTLAAPFARSGHPTQPALRGPPAA
jgi:hypothetical protein